MTNKDPLLRLAWMTNKDPLLHLAWMTKDPLHSTGDYVQRCSAAWMGRGTIDTGICVAETLRYLPATITALLIGYTPIQNKKVRKKMKLFATRSLEMDASPHQLLQGKATFPYVRQRGRP